MASRSRSTGSRLAGSVASCGLRWIKPESRKTRTYNGSASFGGLTTGGDSHPVVLAPTGATTATSPKFPAGLISDPQRDRCRPHGGRTIPTSSCPALRAMRPLGPPARKLAEATNPPWRSGPLSTGRRIVRPTESGQAWCATELIYLVIRDSLRLTEGGVPEWHRKWRVLHWSADPASA